MLVLYVAYYGFFNAYEGDADLGASMVVESFGFYDCSSYRANRSMDFSHCGQ